jgi:hypothetical protein
MTAPVQKLMAKELDRGQFLLHTGAVVLTLAGVSGLIKAVTQPTTGDPVGGDSSSSYGGHKQDRP